MNLRVVTCNRPFIRISRHERLPSEHEMCLANLLVHEMRVFKELEAATYDLSMRPDSQPLALYRAIDRFGDGRINTTNIDHFFKSHNIYLS